jgi:DNA-binding NtrC family response regulator
VPRVLVVDDNDLVRELLQTTMARAGYEVAEACDGNVAIQLLEDQSFDIVITDIIMPDKEGLELIAHIHRNYPGVKVIAISGSGEGPTRVYLDSAERLGARRSFAKPIDRTQLLETVEQLLRCA